MKKGILFDLDGTLWDSAEQVVKAWNEILDTHYPELSHRITVEELHGYMGKTLDEIGRLMFPDLEEEKCSQVMRECCDHENAYLAKHGGILFDGVREMLEQLSKKYSLYIVSNCQAGYIECFLAYYGLEKYFEDHECPGGTGLGKGDNNRIIIERNHLDKAVYVGDTQGDMESADYAEIPFIHAAYGFGSVDRDTEKIHAPLELVELADKLL